MPPEYIQKRQISEKYDIFSLGVIIIQIITGPLGRSKYADMLSSEEFIQHVREAISLHQEFILINKMQYTLYILLQQQYIMIVIRLCRYTRIGGKGYQK